jgi:hypothetical protein
MNNGEILNRAWQITKEHRVLWVFGLLVALSSSRTNVDLEYDQLPYELQDWLYEFANTPTLIAMIVVLILVGIAISLIVALLSAVGRAALVDQVTAIEREEQPTLRDGWQRGVQHALQVFLIVLLLGLPAFILIMVGLGALFVPLIGYVMREGFASRGDVPPELIGGLACFAPACGLGVIVAIVTGAIQVLAIRFHVIEGRGVLESIAAGWRLLREQFGKVAVFWLILVGVRFLVGLILAIPMCLLGALFALPMAVGSGLSDAPNLVCLCGGGLILWAIGALLNSVVETYFSTCWTLAFRQLRAPAP